MDELSWRVVSLGTLLIVLLAWFAHGLARIRKRKSRSLRLRELGQERAPDDSKPT